MVGTSAASHDNGKLARINSALDSDLAYSLSHVGIDDAIHTERRIFDREPHGPGNVMLNSEFRRVAIKRNASAGKITRIEITENKISIRAGWQPTTPSVACRSWIGARALRSHS